MPLSAHRGPWVSGRPWGKFCVSDEPLGSEAQPLPSFPLGGERVMDFPEGALRPG